MFLHASENVDEEPQRLADVGALVQHHALGATAHRGVGHLCARREALLREILEHLRALGYLDTASPTGDRNLASLHFEEGRYAEAELLYKRSLAVREKALGPDHPAVGTLLNNLAGLYRAQGRYAEAESLYKRSLAVREKALGPDHADVGNSLNNLAFLYRSQGR